MFKVIPITLLLIIFSSMSEAHELCAKDRFEYRGVLSNSSIIRFKKRGDGRLGVDITEMNVYRPASVCDKKSPYVCLDIGGEIGTLFHFPKLVLSGKLDRKEWKYGHFIFRVKFHDKEVYVIDSFLRDHPLVKRFSFYYVKSAGLLSITQYNEKKTGTDRFDISDTYISTCPGFLSVH